MVIDPELPSAEYTPSRPLKRSHVTLSATPSRKRRRHQSRGRRFSVADNNEDSNPDEANANLFSTPRRTTRSNATNNNNNKNVDSNNTNPTSRTGTKRTTSTTFATSSAAKASSSRSAPPASTNRSGKRAAASSLIDHTRGRKGPKSAAATNADAATPPRAKRPRLATSPPPAQNRSLRSKSATDHPMGDAHPFPSEGNPPPKRRRTDAPRSVRAVLRELAINDRLPREVVQALRDEKSHAQQQHQEQQQQEQELRDQQRQQLRQQQQEAQKKREQHQSPHGHSSVPTNRATPCQPNAGAAFNWRTANPTSPPTSAPTPSAAPASAQTSTPARSTASSPHGRRGVFAPCFDDDDDDDAVQATEDVLLGNRGERASLPRGSAWANLSAALVDSEQEETEEEKEEEIEIVDATLPRNTEVEGEDQRSEQQQQQQQQHEYSQYNQYGQHFNGAGANAPKVKSAMLPDGRVVVRIEYADSTSVDYCLDVPMPPMY